MQRLAGELERRFDEAQLPQGWVPSLVATEVRKHQATFQARVLFELGKERGYFALTQVHEHTFSHHRASGL